MPIAGSGTWERQPDGGGHYHLAGSVGDFALTDASRAGGADATSQASAFGFGTVVVAFAVGAQATKPVPPVKTGITDIETLLQNLLPGVPASDSRTRPCPPPAECRRAENGD